jgi:hypothetical protein
VVIAESIVEEKQAEVAAVFEQTEHNRPAEPHWYLSLIGIEVLHQSKGRGAALLEHRLRQCDRQHLLEYLWSSNPLTTSLYQRHGFDIAGTIRVGSSPFYPMLRSGTAKPAHASTSHSFAERTSSEKCHARPADDAGYLAAAHLCRICDNDRKPPCAPYRVWGRAGRSSGRA